MNNTKNKKTLVEKLSWAALPVGLCLVFSIFLVAGVASYSGGEPHNVIENVEVYNEAPSTEVSDLDGEEYAGAEFESNLVHLDAGFEYREEMVIHSETNERNKKTRALQIKDFPSDGFKVEFDAPWSTSSTLVDVRLNFAGTVAQVASSSYRFGCGITTSTDRMAFDAPSLSAYDDVINVISVATSSEQDIFTNTSTKSVVQLVEPSQTLVCYGQYYDTGRTVCRNDGAGCEAVSSSARGFTLQLEALWEKTE